MLGLISTVELHSPPCVLSTIHGKAGNSQQAGCFAYIHHSSTTTVMPYLNMLMVISHVRYDQHDKYIASGWSSLGFPSSLPLAFACSIVGSCRLQFTNKRLNDTFIITIATHLGEPVTHSYAFPEAKL